MLNWNQYSFKCLRINVSLQGGSAGAGTPLTLCCLFVTLSELWLRQQRPAGAFLMTNKVEMKAREEGQRQWRRAKTERRTEGESGRSGSQWVLGGPDNGLTVSAVNLLLSGGGFSEGTIKTSSVESVWLTERLFVSRFPRNQREKNPHQRSRFQKNYSARSQLDDAHVQRNKQVAFISVSSASLWLRLSTSEFHQ